MRKRIKKSPLSGPDPQFGSVYFAGRLFYLSLMQNELSLMQGWLRVAPSKVKIRIYVEIYRIFCLGGGCLCLIRKHVDVG